MAYSLHMPWFSLFPSCSHFQGLWVALLPLREEQNSCRTGGFAQGIRGLSFLSEMPRVCRQLAELLLGWQGHRPWDARSHPFPLMEELGFLRGCPWGIRPESEVMHPPLSWVFRGLCG